jgi:predicted HTH transcriptional regulator
MTSADIQRLARRGEGPTLEFKQRTPEPPRLAKEIIAFANTDGGRLLIGVEDDGSVVGVKDAAEEEFALRKALSEHCQPEPVWRSERVQITKKRDVIVVAIPRSKLRPHFLIESTNGEPRAAYVRVEDRSIEASSAALDLMISSDKPRDVHFEFGDLELGLMRYLEQYGRTTVDAFSRNAGIDEQKAQNILVTLAKAKVLAHHIDFNGDYFTLTYDR